MNRYKWFVIIKIYNLNVTKFIQSTVLFGPTLNNNIMSSIVRATRLAQERGQVIISQDCQ